MLVSLLLQADSKFLHVLYRNGQEYDNRDSDLEVLCIGFHAEERMHEHMKNLPECRKYMERYSR